MSTHPTHFCEPHYLAPGPLIQKALVSRINDVPEIVAGEMNYAGDEARSS
jgi:hypothetical protein